MIQNSAIIPLVFVKISVYQNIFHMCHKYVVRGCWDQLLQDIIEKGSRTFKLLLITIADSQD